MKNYLDNISEGQQLDSFQDCYLTHTTIMRHFIDSESYDRMMINVIKDIVDNDNIINNIKSIKRKQKLFIGEIIYLWARREYHGHFISSQRFPHFGDFWHHFSLRFEDAFSRNVTFECQYKVAVRNYELKIKNDKKNKNKYNIILSEFHVYRFYDGIRMVAIYDEKNHQLKINYIENLNHTWRTTPIQPKDIATELFKGVKKIIDQIAENKGSKPEIICKEKYIQIYKKAKERRFLDDKKKIKYLY